MMQRLLLSITGISLTVVGGWMSFGGGAPDIGSVMFRSGLVISALALALPQVKIFFQFFPPWLIACGVVGGFVMLRWPRSAVFVLPGLAALWFLGPRSQAKRETLRSVSSTAKRPHKSQA